MKEKIYIGKKFKFRKAKKIAEGLPILEMLVLSLKDCNGKKIYKVAGDCLYHVDDKHGKSHIILYTLI